MGKPQQEADYGAHLSQLARHFLSPAKKLAKKKENENEPSPTKLESNANCAVRACVCVLWGKGIAGIDIITMWQNLITDAGDLPVYLPHSLSPPSISPALEMPFNL